MELCRQIRRLKNHLRNATFSRLDVQKRRIPRELPHLPNRVDRATSPPPAQEFRLPSSSSDSEFDSPGDLLRFDFVERSPPSNSSSSSSSDFDLAEFRQKLKYYHPKQVPKKVHQHGPGEFCLSDFSSEPNDVDLFTQIEDSHVEALSQGSVPETVYDKGPATNEEPEAVQEIAIPIRSIKLSDVILSSSSFSDNVSELSKRESEDELDVILKSHQESHLSDELRDDIGVSGKLEGFEIPDSIYSAKFKQSSSPKRGLFS
jgi:hypothetical protein